MHLLKEHQELSLQPDFDIQELEDYLQEIWNDRNYFYDFEDDDLTNEFSKQRFISLLRGNRIKASQHIGFLQLNDLDLIVYPKLLSNLKEEDLIVFYKHLVYWLSYCRRINFPFNNILADLTKMDDLPEALIYYFSKRALEVLRDQPYSSFELVEEESLNIRGKLLTAKYISQSIVKGNYHKFICEHNPFVFDNLLNRIIKSVTRKLIKRCRFKESWYNLEQIIFILDEVEDIPVTASDCDKIRLNQLFSDYTECLEMCRFFLSGEQVRTLRRNDRQFCFLLPMNHIFEDFLCGFIEVNFKGRLKTSYQYKGWLTDQKVFQMRNDLVILNEHKGISVIIDAKYKLRDGSSARKKGISQSDMYQMVAYAVRNNCDKILLIYPQIGLPDTEAILDTFTVSSPMLNAVITVCATNITITCSDASSLDSLIYEQLEKVFKHELIDILE